MATTTLIQAILGALAGLALGLAFFRGLALTTRLYLEGGGIRRALPLHLLRLGGAALAFSFAAVFVGAAALLGMLAGFQAARTLVVRRERGAP